MGVCIFRALSYWGALFYFMEERKMRKNLALLLVLTLVFALVACDNKKDTTSKPNTSNTTQTETESTNNTKTTDDDTIDEISSDTATSSSSVPIASTESSKPTTSNKNNTTSSKPSDITSTPTTSEPTTSTPSTSIPQKELGKLTVLNFSFDSIRCSDSNNIIAGKRNGFWGATDINGKTIVPFEYNEICSPTNDGYTLAIKTSNINKNGEFYQKSEYHLYNSAGKIVYSASAQNDYATTGDYWNDHSNDFSFSGEKVYSYNEGILLTMTSEGDNGVPAHYTLNIKEPNGKLIKSFKNVWGHIGYTNGKLYISVPENDSLDAEIIVACVDKSGKILNKVNLKGNSIDVPTMYVNSWAKGVSGGYFLVEIPLTYSFWMLDTNLNPYEYKFTDYTHMDNYGTKVALKDNNGKSILADMKDGIKILSKNTYDSLYFASYFNNSVKYAYVSRNGKSGYLSLDGKTEKLFDSAGDFWNSKAIVKNNNKIYIINENFETISEEISGYDYVGTIGNNIFAVSKNDVIYPVILK